MDHLEAGLAPANLAEAGNVHTRLKLRLLLAGKMKEAKRKLSTAIIYPDKQISSSAKNCFGEQYLAGDETSSASFQRSYLDELRPVFVTQRQQKKQIVDPIQA